MVETFKELENKINERIKNEDYIFPCNYIEEKYKENRLSYDNTTEMINSLVRQYIPTDYSVYNEKGKVEIKKYSNDLNFYEIPKVYIKIKRKKENRIWTFWHIKSVEVEFIKDEHEKTIENFIQFDDYIERLNKKKNKYIENQIEDFINQLNELNIDFNKFLELEYVYKYLNWETKRILEERYGKKEEI